MIREVNEAAEVEVATWIRKRTPNPSNASQIDVNKHATRQLGRKTYNSPYNSWNYTMSDNKKQERDFTPEVDAILPETTSLAQVYLFPFTCCNADVICCQVWQATGSP